MTGDLTSLTNYLHPDEVRLLARRLHAESALARALAPRIKSALLAGPPQRCEECSKRADIISYSPAAESPGELIAITCMDDRPNGLPIPFKHLLDYPHDVLLELAQSGVLCRPRNRPHVVLAERIMGLKLIGDPKRSLAALQIFETDEA